jgi:hypothetical protein
VYSLGAPIAITVAMGLSTLWENSDRLPVRLIGATTVATTSYMSIRILEYGQSWSPMFVALIAALGVLSTIAWLLLTKTKLCVALVAASMVLGPVASNAHTIATPQRGTNPLSGPISSDPRAISRHLQNVKAGKPAWALQVAFGASPSSKVAQLLKDADATVVWPAATYTAQNAAQYQLETLRPVMAIGGWLGADPAPTLKEFKSLVAEKKVGYFIWQQDLLDLGGLGRDATEITMWVQSNFAEETVDGVRIYDLHS